MNKSAELAWRRGHARTAHSMAKWVPDDELAERIQDTWDAWAELADKQGEAFAFLTDGRRSAKQLLFSTPHACRAWTERLFLGPQDTRVFFAPAEDGDGFDQVIEPCSCHHCGCTDMQACVDERGPCWWVEPGLCSHCAWPLPNPRPPGELKPDGDQVNEPEPRHDS